jgi:hypothetical protein
MVEASTGTRISAAGASVDGELAQRRRTVDQQVVPAVAGQGAEEAEKDPVAAHGLGEAALGEGQLGRCGDEVDAVGGAGADQAGERAAVLGDEGVEQAGAAVADAEPGAAAGLGIEVEDEDPPAELSQGGGEVHRRRGLAAAALLVGDGNDSHLGNGEWLEGRKGRG